MAGEFYVLNQERKSYRRMKMSNDMNMITGSSDNI